MKKYDKFLLESYGIYYSLNKGLFKEAIKGRVEISDGILALYNEAKLENEKISLLYDLLTVGYPKDKLVEIILDAFKAENRPKDLWSYSIKQTKCN